LFLLLRSYEKKGKPLLYIPLYCPFYSEDKTKHALAVLRREVTDDYFAPSFLFHTFVKTSKQSLTNQLKNTHHEKESWTYGIGRGIDIGNGGMQAGASCRD
jgi:hypothetical protein